MCGYNIYKELITNLLNKSIPVVAQTQELITYPFLRIAVGLLGLSSRDFFTSAIPSIYEKKRLLSQVFTDLAYTTHKRESGTTQWLSS